MHENLTYEEAKELLDAAKNASNGVQLKRYSNTRIFWGTGSQSKNIEVYLWSRSGRRHRYGESNSMAERRAEADQARREKIAKLRDDLAKMDPLDAENYSRASEALSRTQAIAVRSSRSGPMESW